MAAFAQDAAGSSATPVDLQAAAAAPGTGRSVRPVGGSMNPDLSFIADFALAAFSSDEASQLGAHDPTVRGFNLQQLELAIGSAVDPWFRLDGNLVFSQFGVEIEEIYSTTTSLPAGLQIRAGQFLTRYGRSNPTHPHSWHFVDQPLMLGRLMGGEGNRGLGAEGSVLLPLPWSVELLVSSTMANGAATARSFYGATDLGVRGPADLQTTAAVKQFFPLSDDLSLAWGLSYAGGPNPWGRTRTELYGTDVFLKLRPITRGAWAEASITAEWTLRRTQVPDDLLTDHTGYVAGYWRFARRWAVAARYELGSPTFDLSGAEVPDPALSTWDGQRSRTSANATFWPTEFSRLRLQGSRDDLEWVARPVWAAFLAAEFVVGAHGAHKF